MLSVYHSHIISCHKYHSHNIPCHKNINNQSSIKYDENTAIAIYRDHIVSVQVHHSVIQHQSTQGYITPSKNYIKSVSLHPMYKINKSHNQKVVSKNAVQSKAIAVFSPTSTHTVLKSSTLMAVEEGENGCRTNDATGASPPPWLSGYARKKQPAALVQRGVQHNLGVQVEKAAKVNVSDHDTDMAAAELSRAPECAACVTHAEKRKTSTRPQ